MLRPGRDDQTQGIISIGCKRVFVMGGAGFICSALRRRLLGRGRCHPLNIEKTTYAANLDTLMTFAKDAHYRHSVTNICDHAAMATID